MIQDAIHFPLSVRIREVSGSGDELTANLELSFCYFERNDTTLDVKQV